MRKMSEKLIDTFSILHDWECTKSYVGEYKSLTIEFAPPLSKTEHGLLKKECYIGAYNADWKIYKANMLICDSAQFEGTELYKIVAAMTMGSFKKIQMLNNNTILVTLGHDYCVEFKQREFEWDEMFHASFPKSIYVCYVVSKGWRVGPSNTPWTGGEPI